MPRFHTTYDARGRRVLAALALAFAALAAPASAQPPQLVRELPAGALVPSLVAFEAHRVEVDPAPLAAASPELVLELDGRLRHAVRTGYERRGAGEVAWFGRLAEGGGDVILTLSRGVAIGLVYATDGIWSLTTDADGRQRVERLDPDRLPECAGGEQLAAFDPTGATASASVPATTAGGVAWIDVMTLYSPQARDAAGGPSAIEATAQAAIDATNAAFEASQIDLRLRLVHTGLASGFADSGDVQGDLGWLAGDPQVAALRDTWGADLVGLLVEDGGSYCGVGYLWNEADPAASAFQVTARTCAVNNLSLAHEHGHNLGMDHDPANATGAGPEWSHGHLVSEPDAAGNFRTVLAYATACAHGCPRVPRFSNPAVSYNGAPTGVAEERDNHLTAVLRAAQAAAFRPTVVPFPVFVDGFEDGSGGAWSS